MTKNRNNPPTTYAVEIATWILAIVVTVRFTLTVIDHDMSVMATIAIALSVLTASKRGADALLHIAHFVLNGGSNKSAATD